MTSPRGPGNVPTIDAHVGAPTPHFCSPTHRIVWSLPRCFVLVVIFIVLVQVVVVVVAAAAVVVVVDVDDVVVGVVVVVWSALTPMIVGVVAVVNVEVVEVIVVSPFHPIARAGNQCWFCRHPCGILFCVMTTTMASTTAATNTDCYVPGPNNPVRDIVHIISYIYTRLYSLYVYVINIYIYMFEHHLVRKMYLVSMYIVTICCNLVTDYMFIFPITLYRNQRHNI